MTSKRIVTFIGVLAVALLSSEAVPTASAANLFATVSQTGALISGSGVSGVSYLGVGRYEVTFTTDVSQCAYVATTVNAYSQALQVTTAGGHAGVYGVYVETKNQGGGLTNGPFHLVVACGTPKMRFAVVGYASDLVRATPGAVLNVLGTGRYSITFLESVSACAFIATVGDPGNGLVFAPAGVYTGSGADGKTVYIETKNPGGGLQGGIPFHLAVICSTAPQARAVVVRNTGLPQRGWVLTSSLNSSVGNYAIATNIPIAACATVATRGSVDRAVPFTPATVELTPGPAPNTVGIQVRSLLFFGGGLMNEAFHAATVCR